MSDRDNKTADLFARVHLRCVAATPADFPLSEKPEIVFVGRSNVGKSTLLNALCRNKKLARTSGTPGKTRMIFFFDVAGRVHLVDLPGYGYAKASRHEIATFSGLTAAYFEERRAVALVLILLDVRRGWTDYDHQMADFLDQHQIPWLTVLTKCDKLTRDKLNRSRESIRREWIARYEETAFSDPHHGESRLDFKTFATAAGTSFHDSGVRELRSFLNAVARDGRRVNGARGGLLKDHMSI